MENPVHPIQLTIRPFEPSDLDSVYDIERRSFPHPWSRIQFSLSYRRNQCGFLVAVGNGKVVGYVIAEKAKRIEPRKFQVKRCTHLLNIAVDPRLRRKGVGNALMEAITARVREEGVKNIWLEVRTSNSPARNFYSRIGFQEKGRKPRYYLSEDAVVLMKEL